MTLRHNYDVKLHIGQIMRNLIISIFLFFAILGGCKAFKIEIPGMQKRPNMFFEDRNLRQIELETEWGISKLWICDDPNCPEGCTSSGPDAWGNGLIVEESRRFKEKQAEKE